MNTPILPQIADGEDKSSQFKNCIRKNYRHLRKWAKRTETDAFRVYDREINHYPLAIDFYAGRYCVHYFSKHREEEEPDPIFAAEVEEAICSIFGAKKEEIYWRTRIRRRKLEQYEKTDLTGDFFTVHEFGLKFRVNLLDYLDTGLFLDHRETRKLVGQMAAGKRVLNLFAYTCAFSIHAAAGGATFTKSVDMSNTYTVWGRENFRLNELSERNNEIVRADCLRFLEDEIRTKSRYDIIIIDPPTISRSKKMTQLFDVQVDYISLINSALKLLTPTGTIIFSTNSRRFVFDESLKDHLKVIEISEKTLPLDFHDPKIHRCWKIAPAS